MADSVLDTFKNLKVGILGTKTDAIDKEIDSSLRSIETYSSNVGRNRYVETIKNLISTTGVDNPDLMLKSFQTNQRIETYDQSGRINRYKEYDAILSKISYCQRALKVLTDNIISPDEITKRSIQFLVDEQNRKEKTKADTTIGRLKNIERDIKFEKYIDKIVSSTLKKGDFFIEILHAPKGEQALTILNESTITEKITSEQKEQLFKDHDWLPMGPSITWKSSITIKESEKKERKIEKSGTIILEYGEFGGALSGISPNHFGLSFPGGQGGSAVTHSPNPMTEPMSKDQHKTKGLDDDPLNKDDKFKSKFDDKSKDEEQKDGLELKDIFISLHQPQYVIRLETERFRTCLGYLVFPKVDPMTLNMGGMGAIAGNTINAVCTNIIKQLHDSLKSNTQDTLRVSDDLRETILKYLDVIQNNEDLKIRYVPPDMMVHWRINVDRFDPYGESILECVNFDARLLIALKTATTIKRLSSSTDKRIISVETGLPRDAKNLIEMVKEGMRKRKISIDSMGSIDTIPSQIVTFEDIYLPMRDGKDFVKFDHQQFGPNPQEDIEGLKFIRDNIVANLGVPAPFLGLEENTCLPSYTKIRLLEGYSLEIGKLVKAYEKDPENFEQWVYSIDPETKKVIPGKITKAMMTRKNAKLVRVHLDDGNHFDCTPDHKIMLRDGEYKEAQYLIEDEALMPCYIRKSGIKTRNNVPYMQVYHPGTGRWQVIHRAIAESLGMLTHGDRKQIHHIDENPLNNHVQNLIALTPNEHFDKHTKYRYNRKTKQPYQIKETRNCCICETPFETKIQSNQSTCLSQSCLTERKRQDGYRSWEKKKSASGGKYDKVTTICSACGKEFDTYQHHIDDSKYGFISCSNYECGRKVTAMKNTCKHGNSSSIEIVPCVICGNQIIQSPDKECSTQTCSITCMNTVLSRRRWNGQRQTSNCSFCGKKISITKYDLERNRYIPCDNPECRTAKQGVELWIQKNPQSTFENYLEKFQTRTLSFQQTLDNNKNRMLFDSCLIREDVEGRKHHNIYNCNFCNSEVSVPGCEWKVKKFKPYKSCKCKECKNKAQGMNTKYTRTGILAEPVYLNHKVSRIEWLEERHDCCDLEIEKYHNFAIDSGVFVHNSNRALLSVENISFCRTLISYQKELGVYLRELFEKIFSLIHPTDISDMDDIKIAFPEPKISPYEHEMEYVEQMQRLIEAYSALGVPKKYLRQKYLPTINWDEIDAQVAEEKISKELSEAPAEEDGGMGGMGGAGGGMY